MNIEMRRTFDMLNLFLSDTLMDEIVIHCNKNDPAHKLDHVLGVVKHAELIINTFSDELMEHRKLILTGAYIHDAMCHVDRKEHHVLGAKYALSILEELEPQFNVYERMLIAQSVLEHRASWSGKRINIISEAVAAADRGPIECVSYVKRAVRYRTNQLNIKRLTKEMKFSIVYDAVKHNKEKFGTNGYAYAQMSQYTERLYKDNIIKMCHILDNEPETMVAIGMENFDEWTKD